MARKYVRGANAAFQYVTLKADATVRKLSVNKVLVLLGRKCKEFLGMVWWRSYGIT
jgi:hypothetical protein